METVLLKNSLMLARKNSHIYLKNNFVIKLKKKSDICSKKLISLNEVKPCFWEGAEYIYMLDHCCNQKIPQK